MIVCMSVLSHGKIFLPKMLSAYWVTFKIGYNILIWFNRYLAPGFYTATILCTSSISISLILGTMCWAVLLFFRIFLFYDIQMNHIHHHSLVLEFYFWYLFLRNIWFQNFNSDKGKIRIHLIACNLYGI